jgi:hypothetical protein
MVDVDPGRSMTLSRLPRSVNQSCAAVLFLAVPLDEITQIER